MNIKYACIGLFALLLCASCADDTGSIGIPSDTDVISSSVQTFEYSTRSVELGAVVANSNKSYFGRMHDDDTDIDVSAEFLAQFHTLEGYTLPENIVKNSDGTVACKGAELRLYFNTYKGDGANPMKMQVFELDKDNVISEEKTYYTDLDLSTFVNPQRPTPVVEKTFTAEDQTVSEDLRTSDDYTANVHIPLNASEGQRILQMAVDHPEYFADSYQFIHHVFPGYYFKLKSGNGTMLVIDVCVLNIYFQYKDANDEVLEGVARFSATPEVIQSTRIENRGVAALMSSINDAQGNPLHPYTYLTSPAGIGTELTLPIDDIYQGHETDSISRARIVLTRLNSEGSSTLFDTPTSLLMVRCSSRTAFFEQREVADGITSFVSSFDATANTYTFENINRLVSSLYHEKQSIMQRDGLTSDQYDATYADWNRVVLVPVVTTVNSSNILTSVQNDFSLCSARIVGGTQAQKMQVIYSTFKK